MPGLYVLSSWEALPLKSSRVKACANGYVLSITAQLLYTNPREEPVEGVFIYPLEESELVAGFEAVVGSRRVTFQVQSRHRAQDCCLQCGSSPGRPRRCASGHLVLDEDTERSTFVIITGLVGPAESLAVTLNTVQELPTLPGGALRLILPPVLVPRVATAPERESEPGSLCDDRLALCPTSCFGGPGARSQPAPAAPVESTDVFRGQPYNPFPYEFAFELLVKGPCLLAGLESPTHALRADADPWASSATTTCVTLAEHHHYDKNVEIILYPCEPHQPHLVMEEGTMTYPEYEAHIRSRRDYVRIARRDSSGERQVAFVQKRFHKDIFHNPVLMLNFCPEVEAAPGALQSVTREVLFLIDRSGAVSGPDVDRVKEALLVALKSLPPGTLLNMATFGTDLHPLFPSSRLCSNETLQRACCYLGELRVAAGSPDLLAALSWALAQPLHHGYPRQLFLFTAAAAVGDMGRILQLVRRQASTVRCFSFGMGPRACRRLLTAIAKLSRGRAEFLDLSERLQPKLIKALKKAMEPAVSDITIDWYVPDSTEALLSPTEIAALYPGDRLISYCTLYSIARFRDQRPAGRDAARRGSAVPLQVEAPTPGGTRLSRSSRETSVEISAIGTEESERSADLTSGGDIWKRIYQPSYIQEQYVLTHCSVSTERSQVLLSRSSTSSESTGSRDVAPDSSSAAPDTTSQQGQKSLSLCESSTKSAPLPSAPAAIKVPVSLSSEELARQQKALARAALAGRSFSSPHGELDARRLCRALEKVSQKRNQSVEGQLDQLGPRTPRLQRSTGESNNLLSPTHLDWDMLVEPSYLFSAVVPEAKEPGQGDPCLPLRCHVVIHGLHAGQPVSWEVTASLEALLQPRDGVGSEEPLRRVATAGEKPLHGLAARSVIQDSEKAAQREAELEQGFARRFRLKAMQTSKACNVPSLYTCVVPVDGATRVVLPTAPQVWSTATCSTGMAGSRHRRQRDMEEREALIGAERDEVPGSPVSASSATSGWEKQNGSHGLPTSPSGSSMASRKSTESIAGSRFSLTRRRGPSLMLRPQCLSPESECSSTAASHNYLPLVQLQQARGLFQLTETFSEVVQIPLDRLRRASPYASHRASLSPTSPVAKSSPGAGLCTEGEEQIAAPEPGSPQSHSTCSEVPSAAVWAQADSGHGSESDTAPHSAAPSEAGWQDVGLEDLESASWATAVALAWLEHRCAGFFDEWELVAAKADAWLQAQQLPEGLDVSCLKGAARHLFLLLRHWDENITLNMLCYNPNNV
ncbi:von Willebrand factor A domain-containing protein 5B2 isoform X1 [Tympanuchus pallidicinctus]|uniref:von Willebrand factor A domain-containing protein 5B2 isoform X1 n=1 Tax=Tympanuchus pallidicinctus TaxID=109042 RepID=UPI0022874F68|nr:von Willebrand factor A domain-containing protein 5B2 isoform X1 [Tympanuchus pallidicinctus]